MAAAEGTNQLAEVAAACFPCAFNYLSFTGLTSSIMEDLRRRHFPTSPSDGFFGPPVLLHDGYGPYFVRPC